MPPRLFAPPPAQKAIHAAQPVGPVVSDPPPADIVLILLGHPVPGGAIAARSPLAAPHRTALGDDPLTPESIPPPTR